MKFSLKHLCQVNNHQKCNPLKGRKYITPSDLSANEMKCLITTALELKTAKEKPPYIQNLKGKNISFLLDSPCIRLQSCLHSTSNLLEMPLNSITTSHWELLPYPQDTGRILSATSDIIFCKAHRQLRIESLALGSTVPVVNVSSCRFVLLQILSNLLTLWQHFGSLDGIVIAWVGPPCPLLNTYLMVAPTLNMKVNFFCFCGGFMSPAYLQYVISRGETSSHNVKECHSLQETLEGAHVISTVDHTDVNVKVKLVDLEKYADKSWVFLHSLPRSSVEVEEEVFNSDRNLVWMSLMNYKWVCAAIIANLLNVDESNINTMCESCK